MFKNKIEDLKLEKANLISNVIKNLEQKKDNILTVQIRDIQIQIDNIKEITIANLLLKKKNINDVNIKNIELQINNIEKISIQDLIREKLNIKDDNIRKLRYQLDQELPSKKIKLQNDIQKYTFNISSENLKNSEVIGDYIVMDYPIKPKKKLIVVVAFVTGFILSIFLAFLLNFINGIKRENKSY